jgi:hypothetical protein
VVWENVFAALHSLTEGKTDPNDPQVKDFVRSNLYLGAEDTRILLKEIATARRKGSALEAQLNAAFAAGREPDETARIRNEVDRSILGSRDQLLRRLSPRGAKALLRYVATIKQGMTYRAPE